MSVLKIVAAPYDSREAAANLIEYICRKACRIGGLSVDPAFAAEQMEMVRTCFDQTTGRQMIHFILAFSAKESQLIHAAGSLLDTAYEICGHFAAEYQIVFGIHHSDGRWHIHFAMNPVSFVSGLRYRADKYADFDLACCVRQTPYAAGVKIVYGGA